MDFKDKKPFVRYKLDEEKAKEKEVRLTICMNKAEMAMLDLDKGVLEQSKNSTALKQLWMVGRNVLHDKKTGLILRSLFKNRRNNERSGIIDFE